MFLLLVNNDDGDLPTHHLSSCDVYVFSSVVGYGSMCPLVSSLVTL
jgi:hypothetical protein